MRIHAIRDKFSEKTDHLPRTVTMMVKALSYFGVDASGLSMLEKELEEASENYNVNKLLTRMHDVMPIGVLKDLWWPGYLGSDQSMTKLYEKGHYILMELMDCGILKDQESGYLFMNKSFLKDDVRDQCLDEIPNLGLAAVFRNDTERFGKLAHCEETDVAGLPSLSELSNLRELYLSHCTTLKQFPSLESATNLEVLDVSKCSAFEDIGNSTFEQMICLRKLDLSETKISYLPVLNVAGITSLASNGAEPVKDMSKLEVLDMSLTYIEGLPSVKLEVLDLSGSSVKSLPKFSSSKNLLKLLLGDCLLEEDFPTGGSIVEPAKYVLPARANRGIPAKRYSPERISKGSKYPMANIAVGNLSKEAKAFTISLYSENVPSNVE
nr:hypothetical protein [Tanacetum cinerariifolium]